MGSKRELSALSYAYGVPSRLFRHKWALKIIIGPFLHKAYKGKRCVAEDVTTESPLSPTVIPYVLYIGYDIHSA